MNDERITYDEAAYIAHCVEESEIHDLEEEAGLLLCSKCGTFAVQEHKRWTGNYGGGWDTWTECHYCGDKEVAV